MATEPTSEVKQAVVDVLNRLHAADPSDRPPGMRMEAIIAAAVLDAFWPLAVAAGRAQAAADIRAAGRDPYRNLVWMYPDEAAKIADGGGSR